MLILEWIGDNWTMVRDLLGLLMLLIIFLLSLRFVRRKEFEEHKKDQEKINKRNSRDILIIQKHLEGVATHNDVANIKVDIRGVEKSIDALNGHLKGLNNNVSMITRALMKGDKQ